MIEFALHPNVYATGAGNGLLRMLEQVWIREHTPGQGTIYMVSGFGNFNGGVRFYEYFRNHISNGGKVVGIFGGSTSQSLTSRQLVRELLNTGSEIHVINRKRILHAKIYGSSTDNGERLIVSSGNFTGPGLSLNVEASASMDIESTRQMGFSWNQVVSSLCGQAWDIYTPTLADLEAPAWRLLYDEYERELVLDESEETTLLVTLSHADTARIQAEPRTNAGKGTQYFWLSRDCYGFFPPLTIRNQEGEKATFSCLITMRYVDLNLVANENRVTFEAENNLDFRLGTGPLRYTKLAAEGDVAAISRIGDAEYELRIFRRGSREYEALLPYTVTNIGHRGKRYGYIENSRFEIEARLLLPVRARRGRITNRSEA
jgi:hypothetical protein